LRVPAGRAGRARTAPAEWRIFLFPPPSDVATGVQYKRLRSLADRSSQLEYSGRSSGPTEPPVELETMISKCSPGQHVIDLQVLYALILTATFSVSPTNEPAEVSYLSSFHRAILSYVGQQPAFALWASTCIVGFRGFFLRFSPVPALLIFQRRSPEACTSSCRTLVHGSSWEVAVRRHVIFTLRYPTVGVPARGV